jgi:hypothetical protein
VRKYRLTIVVTELLVFLSFGAAILAGLLPFGSLQRFATASFYGAIAPPAAPAIHLSEVWNRRFQGAMEPWLTARMGWPREAVTRLNNGLGYLLDHSFVPSVSIGREKNLFHARAYNNWCVRPPFPIADEVADRIKAIQDMARAQGKAFIFVMSPEKVAVYQDLLPADCRPAKRPTAYDLLGPALAARGVAVIDGVDISRKLRETQPWPVFGRDGGHWNDIPSVAVVSAIYSEIGKQIARSMPTIDVIRVDVDDQPRHEEGDFGSLLNLPFALHPYPSPHAVIKRSGSYHPPRIILVGTSFSWALLRVISAVDGLEGSNFLHYFHQKVMFTNGAPVGAVVFNAAAEFGDLVESSEAIVVELNTPNLNEKFLEALQSSLRSLAK